MDGEGLTINKICGNCIYWSPAKKDHKECEKCGDGRNHFVPRDIQCPVSSCQAGMIYYADGPYLECPDCGTQIWPFAMLKSDCHAIRQEFEKSLPCDRNKDKTHGAMVTVHSKLNGGSKSKGKNKKALMQKKSTTQIYKELTSK